MLTAEHIKEFKKCKEDPIYFICNYIKVVHPVRGLVPFALYPFQKRIVDDLQNYRFNILRKFRQAGCTTISAAYALWFTMFQDHKTVAILSKGEAEATEVLERCQIMWAELPDWLKRPVKEKNKHTLRFNNGSVVKSRASSKQAGRSLAGSLLILDEAAFIEHIDTIWAAVYPIISTGGKVFALSTVNGMGNWFHTKYTEAKDGLNDFHPIDINWEDHPEYKRHKGYEWLYQQMLERTPPVNIDDWERITRGNIGHKEWLQEYECAFLGTGDTYIDGEVLSQLTEEIDHEFRNEYSKRLRVWDPPYPMYDYLIGVDVSLGRNMDYSAFHVINVYNGKQVAEFYSNSTSINDLASILLEVAKKYNNAYIAIERNALGHVLIDNLVNKYEYECVLEDEKGDYGVQLTLKNRETILAVMEEFVRMRHIKISSERTLNELVTFIINEQGKPEADENMHDDLVMSLALSCYSIKELLKSTPIEHEHVISEFQLPENPIKSSFVHDGQTETYKDFYKWLLT